MARYRIQEFAELAGVTVKALHHYDRLGLLTPRRSGAGYRMYTDGDVERLEQIVALKFLGMPLNQIKTVLEGSAVALPEALRMQRRGIEQKQALLAAAVRAIQAAEESLAAGKAADPEMLRRIIEVIDMQNDIEWMKKYYSEDSWERRRRYYQDGPSAEWVQLYRDAGALLQEDPGSSAAQALADRWLRLSVRAWTGDPDAQTDSTAAWMDRQNWPPAMKQRMAEYRREEVTAFIQRAGMCARKKYFSAAAWTRYEGLRERRLIDTDARGAFWQERLDLFHELEAAAGEDPAGERGQSLAHRWTAQIDEESGGDPEVKAGLLTCWADRANWSATVRWYLEGIAMMNTERFEKAAGFLDDAARSLAAR
ncbi:MAG TPA: MerR family transcriptional regulator [Bryobacteraceae bacterium]|jgi:DNA-binding transcriptional MerR regulator|nr:MerR family transcriptional regulator [Bryobacteraceae bacterium]